MTDDFYADRRARDGLQSQCKSCMNAKSRAYYAANMTAIAKQQRGYYIENREKVLDRVRRRYVVDRPNTLRRVSLYRVRNASDIAAKRRARRLEDPARTRVSDRLMYQRNAAAYKSRARARRHSIEGAPGYDESDVRRLLVLQQGRCMACRCRLRSFEIDHIQPLSRGGQHCAANIQLLCRPCNRRKHAKHPVDFMQELGYLL